MRDIDNYPFIQETWQKDNEKLTLEGHIFSIESAMGYKAKVAALKASGWKRQTPAKSRSGKE